MTFKLWYYVIIAWTITILGAPFTFFGAKFPMKIMNKHVNKFKKEFKL